MSTERQPNLDDTKPLPRVETEKQTETIHTRGGLGNENWKRLLTLSKQPLPKRAVDYGQAVIGGMSDENFGQRSFLDRRTLTGLFVSFGGEEILKGNLEQGSDADIALFLRLTAARAYSAKDFITDKIKQERLQWNEEQWEKENTREIKRRVRRNIIQVFPASPDETATAVHRAFLYGDETSLLTTPLHELYKNVSDNLHEIPDGKTLEDNLTLAGYPRHITQVKIPGPIDEKRVNYVVKATAAHYMFDVPFRINLASQEIIIAPSVRTPNSDRDPDYFAKRRDEILLTGVLPPRSRSRNS